MMKTRRLNQFILYRFLHDRAVWGAGGAVIAASAGLALLGRRGFEGFSDDQILQRILQNPLLSIWAGVILSYVFITTEFQNRTVHIVVSQGYGRMRFLLFKAFWYYFFGVLVLWIGVVLTALMVCKSFTLDSVSFRMLSISAIIHMGTLTYPFVLSLVLKTPLAAFTSNILFAYFMQKLLENNVAAPVLWFYPPHMQMHLSAWLTEPRAFTYIMICVLTVLAGFSISLLAFRRYEMK